jgi:glycosyltransferase involved in cell wall biosynthesis
VYFHENQFEYPVREEIERDGQFGWSQVLSALSADFVLWNSNYNLQSFLAGFRKFSMTMPKEQRPNIDAITESIKQKSHVTYFPVDPISITPVPLPDADSLARPLHVIWNHRWEWDKGPDALFKVLFKLAGIEDSATQAQASSSTTLPDTSQGKPSFFVSVIGESFGEVPAEFQQAQKLLAPYIRHWGYLESKDAYFQALKEADIVISTAQHEFFGVSIIEAIHSNCYPLCPQRLVFPEYLPDQHLYRTDDQLAKKLRYYVKYPEKLRSNSDWKSAINLDLFSWPSFVSKIKTILNKPI